MIQQYVRCGLGGVAIATGWVSVVIGTAAQAIAQIHPDRTLGIEQSVVTPGALTDRGVVDRIDGGAIRGSNLFHSFLDFNVGSGQRVYFANPASIETIISRVTGISRSDINGTLGVLGSASLFLINPNGIVFGPNAQLDIRGSFVASTANRVLFPEGYAFSATNPDTPPLLTINAPLGLASWLPTSGAIANAGNLAAGQDLSLTGATLALQGQLRAGQNLTLIATDRLTARDSATLPFIASAGKQLWVQGNQSIDIAALNHPESGLFSGGDMVLRSANTIGGDVHYTTGGSFRVEQLNGQLGSLYSPHDPVIRASGDVSFDRYTGASLHILAGGSVTIPGTVTITGPEVTDFLAETITLSNGSTVSINGGAQPTLDIRAGTTAFGTVGIMGSTANFTPALSTTDPPSSANITIGSIVNPGGLVFLTNQYQPNPALTGTISVGSITTATDPASGLDGGLVAIDARGPLTFNTIDASGGDYTAFNVGGNGGDVTLLAAGDLFLPFPSSIYSYGLVGGAITLASGTAIIQENAPFGTAPFSLSWIESDTFSSAQGKAVRLTAPTLSIGGNVFASNESDGQGGNIIVTANSLVTDQATILTQTFGPGNAGTVTVTANSISLGVFSTLGSASFSGAGGKGGDVNVQANAISATDGGQIASLALGVGDAGNVNVTAQTISLSGFTPETLAGGLFLPSAIFSSSQAGAEGNGGTVTINTGTLSLTQAALVSTTSYSVGNAGNVVINASAAVRVDGAVFTDFQIDRDVQPSAITSQLFTGAVGRGGNINLTTPVLEVTNGGAITATSNGNGDAGSIDIVATKAAFFDGVATFAAIGQRDRISSASVIADEATTGNGGTLTITTPFLSLTNGGQLTAETRGAGIAGNIILNVDNTLIARGTGSGILASTTPNSIGNGGSISIAPDVVKILDGARIAVDSKGTGTAGNIFLQARSLVLDNNGLISAETVSNTGGNIALQVNDVIVLRRGSRISTSAGTTGAGGDGGNITINTKFLVASPTENSDITANAFSGRGGRVDITAQGLFGFRVLSRSDLETALGTSDPNLLNPAFLPTSDITAISQVNPNLNGEVIIQSPDPDPSRGALPLPPDVVDASRLIAQDCSARGTIARSLGSFTVTGQGGLPPSPTDQLRGDSLLIGWETPKGAARTAQPSAAPQQARSPVQLVEVQTLEKRPDGRVVLVAHTPATSNQEFWSRPATCPSLPANP